MHTLKSRNFWFQWLPVILVVVIIFILSAQTAETKKLFIPSIEIGKELHVFIYFCLSLFLIRALKRKDGPGGKIYLTVFVLGLIYAILDEVHQTLVPGRGGDALDVLIDAFGIFLAIFFVWLWSLIKSWARQANRQIIQFIDYNARLGRD